MDLEFYIAFGSFFLICIAIMIHVNHRLMANADKRLKQANEMVLKLSESCDKLSETNICQQTHIAELERSYEKRLEETTKNRDEMRQAYTALLTKYEMLEGKIFDSYDRMKDASFSTLQGLASRPTISNNNTELGK